MTEEDAILLIADGTRLLRRIEDLLGGVWTGYHRVVLDGDGLDTPWGSDTPIRSGPLPATEWRSPRLGTRSSRAIQHPIAGRCA